MISFAPCKETVFEMLFPIKEFPVEYLDVETVPVTVELINFELVAFLLLDSPNTTLFTVELDTTELDPMNVKVPVTSALATLTLLFKIKFSIVPEAEASAPSKVIVPLTVLSWTLALVAVTVPPITLSYTSQPAPTFTLPDM